MRWDQLDFAQGLFHVRRLKNGRPSVHILRGSELRALLGSGRYLRVFGTVALDQLVELARSLVPIDGGSGIGFED